MHSLVEANIKGAEQERQFVFNGPLQVLQEEWQQ